ncbi:hypothetical protein CW368_06735 [Actinomycetales bacterium SN12]|nr:hypothetical protein CW368_06735 [Actinomycetales bacterium SN12]
MTEKPRHHELSLTELVKIVAAAGAGPDVHGATAAISRADELVHRSQALLVEMVVSARAAGVSWQAIGDALGVSRQAAFKRFGGAARDPDEGHTVSEQTHDLLERTRTVFESLDAGDYEAVRSQMTYACARLLSKRKMTGVWNQVVAVSGRLESSAGLTVQTPGGTNALNTLLNRAFANGAIVQTTLRHEAGEWIARVAYNGSGRITGLIIAPPGSRDLPF